MTKVQAIRGMNDLLPEETVIWHHTEETLKTILTQYGYKEIRTPILENTELFSHSVGEHTDIVTKEMYNFTDRNGESITLRPEFTAGIVRAGIQHGLFYNQIQRLWSQGPLFRYERPQKGRYRQFHQFSVEVLGIDKPEIDAELILLLNRLWKKLTIQSSVTLQINTLGDQQERQLYRQALIDYLEKYQKDLDNDSLRRLQTNPLRILDSKIPQTRKILENAPSIHNYFGKKTLTAFQQLRQILENMHISYTVNPTLVRGLDYYCNTVFEWTTELLGAQDAVCGGGRYDLLVEILGGKSTPACGFGLGLERLVMLVKENGYTNLNNIDVAIITTDNVTNYAIEIAEKLRDLLPLHIIQFFSGSLKSQMRRADRSGANIAIIIGDTEANNQLLTVKYLRQDKPQQTENKNDMIELVCKMISQDTIES